MAPDVAEQQRERKESGSGAQGKALLNTSEAQLNLEPGLAVCGAASIVRARVRALALQKLGELLQAQRVFKKLGGFGHLLQCQRVQVDAATGDEPYPKMMAPTAGMRRLGGKWCKMPSSWAMPTVSKTPVSNDVM